MSQLDPLQQSDHSITKLMSHNRLFRAMSDNHHDLFGYMFELRPNIQTHKMVRSGKYTISSTFDQWIHQRKWKIETKTNLTPICTSAIFLANNPPESIEEDIINDQTSRSCGIKSLSWALILTRCSGEIMMRPTCRS
jgi:hypothetical protein